MDGGKPGSLEEERQKVIDLFLGHASLKDTEAMIVFDAHRSNSREIAESSVGRVKIVFTRSGQSADQFIERYIYDYKGERRIFVVTSDYAQQKMIFGKGVYRKPPQEMIQEMRTTEKEMREKIDHYQPGPFPLSGRVNNGVRARLEDMRRAKKFNCGEE
ncbi:NYN domain-containing protein [Candidatus Hakubella thermalkaliphila]|uniref:NYN domain-containing protein n=1 Tax=Candidatus Hakubella thermalkaliphila TaxID=2754717 RepID=UPI00280BCBFB|nr:NYN domain-containing protein [Candidatus Hakubella thermalkaliphila]